MSSSGYPIGQDSWNRSKESRQQPELHSSGHGTVDLPWSTGVDSEQDSKANSDSSDSFVNKEEDKQEHDKHQFSGHTRKRQYLPRSVKRDLNNI